MGIELKRTYNSYLCQLVVFFWVGNLLQNGEMLTFPYGALHLLMLAFSVCGPFPRNLHTKASTALSRDASSPSV